MHPFRLILLAVLFACASVGCESTKSARVDNPVMGPPPPRMIDRQRRVGNNAEHMTAAASADVQLGGVGDIPSVDPVGEPHADTFETRDHNVLPVNAVSADAGGASQVILADATESLSNDPNVDLFGSRVVATVDGRPIFASDVLHRYKAQLDQARSQLSPEDFTKLRMMLLRRDLRGILERKLLVTALKSAFTPEQIKTVEGHLAKEFEKEIDRLKDQLKVTTRLEVERVLAENGASLAHMQEAFQHQRMAMEYLGMKAKKPPEVTRPEMLAYYEEHLSEYARPAQVLWEQIYIPYAAYGGRDGARENIDEIVQALKSGRTFSDIDRENWKGPTAIKGGRWDWTNKGSLADERIEDALFTLPVGTISQVLETNGAFQLVRVVERDEAGHTPFEQVQSQIEELMGRERRQHAAKEVFRELLKTATIETIFGEEYDVELRKALI